MDMSCDNVSPVHVPHFFTALNMNWTLGADELMTVNRPILLGG